MPHIETQLIVALASDGHVLYGTQAIADYCGFLPEEIQGSDFLTRAFHPDDIARFKEERRQALAKGLPFKLEMRARRKDGTYRCAVFRRRRHLREDPRSTVFDCYIQQEVNT